MNFNQRISPGFRFWGVLTIILITGFSYGAGHADASRHNDQGSPVKFTENKGQWDDNSLYRLRFSIGALFLEKNKFTYSFVHAEDWERLNHAHHHHADDDGAHSNMRGHVFSVNFMNANSNTQVTGQDDFSYHENYFLGNDPGRWASNVKVYNTVNYKELYDGIDLEISGKTGQLKYSFTIYPGADTREIRMAFNDVDDIFIDNGRLHYVTSVNEIFEERPFSYQEINGIQVEVPSEFTLHENEVSFTFPNGYDAAYPLVIDPVIVFSTYTGSFANNFGFTATYDNSGHLYAGGIAFGSGYPITTGAYNTTYNGGAIDVSLTKFTPDGTGLVYSTFLGGSESENPSSIIVNDQNELIVLGTTSSPDFPTTAGAYDNTFNGGVGKNYPNNGPNFISGTDIFVCKFNAAGSQLVGSTFIGGSGNDGLNDNDIPGGYGTLVYNYGDQFRGEVINDASGNIYAISSTLSNDFPTTPGVFQSVSGGGQDAVVFKFNANLSSLVWSSYLGGTGTDAGYNLFADAQNNIFVSGGTASANFPATAGALNSSYLGGRSDGYIAKISADGSAILNATFLGTSQYDQSYFIDQDASGRVYVVGQTDGNFPITPGVYSNPNSGQFVTALTSDLASVVFSTVFGRGDGDPDISPTAFLVDRCRNIYISGWAGNDLMDLVNPFSFNSTVIGMPITADAYQNTPDATGSDFYFIVLSADAATLTYGTYFGSPSANDHVDGGTSRFDKNGIIYQAVCAGCQNFDDFPTTPGAWSQTNNSFGCNEGLIKFEFQLIGVDVEIQANPDTSGCLPFEVDFTAIGINAQQYYWDLGDGSISHDSVLTHTYDEPGTYFVTLIGIDSTTCDGLVFSDTATATIIVFPSPSSADAGPDEFICAGEIVTLSASGGVAYEWSNGIMIASNSVAPGVTTEYKVTVTDANGCSAIDSVLVTVLPVFSGSVSEVICDGDSIFAGGSFQVSAGTYFDTLLSVDGCDSVIITDLEVLPNVTTSMQNTMCTSDSNLLGLVSETIYDTLEAANGCDSIAITETTYLPVKTTNVQTTICEGASIFLEGAFQTTAGTYLDTLATTTGCDSIIITALSVDTIPEFTQQISICEGDSFFAGGTYQTTSGIYRDTFSRDDTVLVESFMMPPDSTFIYTSQTTDLDASYVIRVTGVFNLVIGLVQADGAYLYPDFSQPQPFMIWSWNGQQAHRPTPDVQNWSYEYFFPFQGDGNSHVFTYNDRSYPNPIGSLNFEIYRLPDACDSIVITNLTVLPAPVTSIDINICEGESHFAGGAEQTTNGTYLDTLITADGCDSIITTNLTVFPASNTVLNIEICQGKSHFAGGANQTQSGIYIDSFVNVFGCDSVVETNLTVLPNSSTVIDIAICDGESHFTGGAGQTTSGIYFDTFVAANGCDSVVETNLTVLPNTLFIKDISICDGESHFAGGVGQTTSGIYFDTLVAANGCDSVVETNLTVLPNTGSIIDISICDGETHFAGGANQTTSGIYFDTLVAANGCDSVIQTSLTVLPNFFSSVDVIICEGENHFAGGGAQTNAGVYLDTLTADNGCDSVITTNLTVLPASVQTVEELICAGESFFAGEDFQTTSGTYFDTLSAANGCDSVIVTNLTISSPGVTFDVRNVSCDCVSGLEDPDAICILNFSGLPHGTILNNQFADLGITISGDAYGNSPDEVIIFNSNLSGTPDPDLEVSIGNLAIFPKDVTDNNGDGLVDVPDDQSSGGKMTFTFDSDRTVYSLELVDNDNNGGTVTAYDEFDNVITTINTPSGADASVQTIQINAVGVRKLVVDYRDSRGVTNIRLSCPEERCKLDFDGLAHGTIITNQFASEGITITGKASGSGPDEVIIFNSNLSGTPDPDLEVNIGNLIILPEDVNDMNGDGLVDVPNDHAAGGTVTFTFDKDRTVYSFTFVDNDRSNGLVTAYDEFNNVIGTVSTPSQAFDGGIQVIALNFAGVRKLEIHYTDSRGITDLVMSCDEECCDGGVIAIPFGGFPPYQYLWSNGETTASLDSLCEGIYSITITDSLGCIVVDSIGIGKDEAIYTNVQVEICEGDSILAGGAYQTVAGTYYDTTLASAECPEVTVTELSVFTSYIDTIIVEVCAGDGFFAGNALQTEAGLYWDTLTSVNGCDSIIAVELSVHSNFDTLIHYDICTHDTALLSLTPDSICALLDCCCCCPWLMPKTVLVIDTLQSAFGCDSMVFIETTYYPIYHNSYDFNICPGDSFFAGGAYQSQSGIYIDSLTGSGGCDSIITTLLQVLPDYRDTVVVIICAGESVIAGGGVQTTSGFYMDSYITSAGCDSIVVTELIILPDPVTNISTEICDGDSVFIGGAWQKESGTYTDTHTASNGCDSLTTVSLTVAPLDSFIQTITICEGDSFFTGSSYKRISGIYFDVLAAANGCDSLLTTLLQVLPDYRDTLVVTICAGESVIAGGGVQSASGFYIDSYITSAGCDSAVVTELVVLPVSTINVFVEICEGDSVFIGVTWRTTSGTYSDTFTAANGCDSISTVLLTVFPVDTFVRSIAICEDDSFFAGGDFQTGSGTYYDVIKSSNSCDSVITTVLEVFPGSIDTISVAICSGDSFQVGGGGQTTSGFYSDAYLTSEGCDSVVVTELVVLPEPAINIFVEICEGDSVFVAGDWQTTSGSYSDTFTTANDCDSISTILLSVSPADTFIQQITICEGDSFFAGGAYQTTPGSYTDVTTGTSNCDSTIITLLEVIPGYFDTLLITICSGDSMEAGGSFQTTSGFYIDTYLTSGGCDSIIITELEVLPEPVTNISVEICSGDSVFIAGEWQTSSGTYSDTFTASNGCDSIATINLEVSPIDTLIRQITICSGDSFFAGGTYQTVSGFYYDVLTGSGNCDSIIQTDLTVSPQLALGATTDSVSCFGGNDGSIDLTVLGGTPGYSFAWSNGETTEDIDSLSAGQYTVTVTDSLGCQATLIVNVIEPSQLVINESISEVTIPGGNDGAIDLSISGGSAPYVYNWSTGDTVEDITNLIAGTYYVTVTDANNCVVVDSIILEDTIAPLQIQYSLEDACNGNTGYVDLEINGGNPSYTYQWAGPNNFSANTQDISALAPGTYSITVTEGSGSSASANIHIGGNSINLTVSEDTTICPNESVQLSASGGHFYSWSPVASINDPAIANPIVNPGQNTTYTVIGSISSGELVVNSDFSAGNTGFTTDYTYTTTSLFPEGTYSVLTNPNTLHGSFFGSDHATGSGNFMAVNGSINPGFKVWCQTITITPNTDYFFSTWISTLVANSPAVLEFTINSAPIGPSIVAPPSLNNWIQYFTTWNSGSVTTAEICIVNANVAAGGNDFGLDDISFTAVCTDTAQVNVFVDGCESINFDTFERPWFNVYPVPFDKKIIITHFSDSNGDGSVRVMDILGKVMKQADMQIVKGHNTHEIEMDPGIAHGLYLVEFRKNGLRSSVRTIMK